MRTNQNRIRIYYPNEAPEKTKEYQAWSGSKYLGKLSKGGYGVSLGFGELRRMMNLKKECENFFTFKHDMRRLISHLLLNPPRTTMSRKKLEELNKHLQQQRVEELKQEKIRKRSGEITIIQHADDAATVFAGSRKIGELHEPAHYDITKRYRGQFCVDKKLGTFMRMNQRPKAHSIMLSIDQWKALIEYFQMDGIIGDPTDEFLYCLPIFASELIFRKQLEKARNLPLQFEFSESGHECGIFRKDEFLGTITRKERSWLWTPGFGICRHFHFPTQRPKDTWFYMDNHFMYRDHLKDTFKHMVILMLQQSGLKPKQHGFAKEKSVAE